MAFQYKVVYMDFRGRVSVEGEEIFIEKNERRSSFARRVMNTLGADGWELTGIQPLWPAETAYLMFKKEGTGDQSIQSGGEEQKAKTEQAPETEGAPTARLDPMPTQGSQAQGGEPPTIIEA
jgi:hypothetical protein